jgi:hypothetical protein
MITERRERSTSTVDPQIDGAAGADDASSAPASVGSADPAVGPEAGIGIGIVAEVPGAS